MILFRYFLAETVYRAVPFFPFNPIRKQLYRLCGLKLPRGSKILWGCRFYNLVANGFENLEIGEDVYITEGVMFDLTGRIVLKDRVGLGFGTRVITHADPGHSHLAERYLRKVAPVIIEEDVWVGSSATILPGVRIGRGSVVAAGSVVTKDVPAGTLVAGVPAEVKKNV